MFRLRRAPDVPGHYDDVILPGDHKLGACGRNTEYCSLVFSNRFNSASSHCLRFVDLRGEMSL